jgi:hypothetical protein
MASQLETLLQETFSDLDNVSPEKMKHLVQEALQTFIALKEKSHSTDPKEREEAFKTAESLKGALQAQAEALSKKAGIDPESFSSLAEDRELFSADTLNELNAAKKQFGVFLDPIKPKKHSLSKKNKAVWLPG